MPAQNRPLLLQLPLDELRRRAPAVDAAGRLPREVLQELGQLGLYRLALDTELGGTAASPPELWDISEALAGACGTTNFVQAQHQGAIGFVLRSSNQPLVAAVLPRLLSGERLCGVAFAHLRRPDSPVHVRQDGEHLVFDGEAPWFTGWGVFEDVVLAGRQADGVDVYALVALDTPGIGGGEPVALSAINASSTVSLALENVRVPATQKLIQQTRAEMAQRDFRSQLGYAALPLGLAREACRVIEQQRPGEPSAAHFLRCADQLRSRALSWSGDEDAALQIRTEANLLAHRAAQAAVITVGGRANQLRHPACRLVREASFYFLTQLNESLRSRYLDAIAHSS